jgi:steroid 5-alpha reductase family enzyme
METIGLVLLGWAIVAAMMAVLWLVQRATHDAGVVDVGWAAGLGVLAVFYALLADGAPVQRLVVGLLAGIWSARLAVYVLLNRVVGKPEDGRYQTLRARWTDRGANVQSRFLIFFEVQGLLDAVMSLPFLVVASIAWTSLRWWQYVAIAIWVVAIAGESVADWQLARFRADPATRGTTCRRGIWNYSRHPNYFFEWLHWWTYVVLAAGFAWWPLALISPVLISLFLFRVTGIPATERQALRSRSDYRDYQQTTSVFVPWFRKRARAPVE